MESNELEYKVSQKCHRCISRNNNIVKDRNNSVLAFIFAKLEGYLSTESNESKQTKHASN